MIIDFVKKYKYFFISFLVVFIISGVLSTFLFYNIVAFIGYQPIWKGDFNETVNLLITRYNQSSHRLSTDAPVSDLLKDDDLRHHIQKEALSRIIEYKIFMTEIEIIKPDWESLAESKIIKAMSAIKESQKFEESIRTLYGMGYNEFKYKVLMPQAQFEIVSEELKKNNMNYDNWMKEQKKAIKIRIMVDGLEWKEGEVQIAQ